MLAILLIIGNIMMARPAFASGETTTIISVNKVYQGTVQNGGEKYYSFTLQNDGLVTLSMLRNSNSSWEVQLTDSNGNQLKDFTTSSGTTAIGYEERQVGLAKGTYYVRIADNDNGSANPFNFQVKYTAGTGYEKELNNSVETANSIQLNTVYKGAMQDYDDQDFYTFTTQSDGNITLSMKRNTAANWHVTLYSADGQTYKDFYTTDGNTAKGYEERQIGLPKGTYYVAVENNDYSVDVNYELQVKFTAGTQFEKEINDSVDQANLISLNKTYQGVLQNDGDNDFFAFSLPSDGNVTLSMNRNTASSWTMTLYSSSGDEYKSFSTSSGSTATGVEEKQIGLPKGKYYVKIEENYSTTDVAYGFQVKFTPSNYYEKENNDSLDSANAISLNAVYKGALPR